MENSNSKLIQSRMVEKSFIQENIKKSREKKQKIAATESEQSNMMKLFLHNSIQDLKNKGGRHHQRVNSLTEHLVWER